MTMQEFNNILIPIPEKKIQGKQGHVSNGRFQHQSHKLQFS